MLPSIASAQAGAVGAPSQVIALTRPAVTIVLNSDAEWKAPHSVEFDPQGNVLVVYRDDKKSSREGNWHLLKISDVLGSSPHRQALTFAPIEEPADPDSNIKWGMANGFLRLNGEGTLAYAILGGAIVTRKPGPLTIDGHRNIESRNFTNVVAIDLESFEVVAKRDVSRESDSARTSIVDNNGNLLVLRTGEVSWTVTAFEAGLNEQSSRVIGGRTGNYNIEACSIERIETIRCKPGNDVVRILPDGKHPFVKLEQGLEN